MEENENDIETARGMSWCKIHKYWHDTIDGCPDCKSDSINFANSQETKPPIKIGGSRLGARDKTLDSLTGTVQSKNNQHTKSDSSQPLGDGCKVVENQEDKNVEASPVHKHHDGRGALNSHND